MKANIKNIQLDTKSDKKYPVNLNSGSLYRVENGLYYIHGRRPIGNDYAKEIFEGTYEEWDEKTKAVITVPYEWTEFISLLSADDLINVFTEEISKTAVIIKDAEFLLKRPIITTGLTKVFLDNCTVHLQDDTAEFLHINSLGTGNEDCDFNGYLEKLNDVVSKGSTISRNVIRPATYYYKYGSRVGQPKIKKYWPENSAYHIEVSKQDQIIESSTDRRGYPQSCGIENREKGVTIIVHNEKVDSGAEPIQMGGDDRIIGVSRDQNIIVVGSTPN